MKIAIDVSPLQTGHKVRGVGFYLEHLRKALLDYHPENEYTFFTRGEKLPKDTDVVHFPYFEPFFLALPIYKQFKTVVTVHDLTPIVFPNAFPRGIKGELKWQMQKYALRNADGIITDSQNSKNDVIKFVKANPNKINVVYLAAGEEFKVIDKDKFKSSEIRKKYGLPNKFALYVGDVTWNKNIPRIINASKLANIPLVLVGKALVSTDFDRNNPWNKDLIEVNLLVEGQKNILRLGFVDTQDLVTIYNFASVFVMPSLYEGFGLPILEAMACGCPVITSREGSLKEVAGNAAFYVDAYNETDITEGIKKLFADNKLRDDYKQKGLEQVKIFSWEKTALETIRTYEKVLSK